MDINTFANRFLYLRGRLYSGNLSEVALKIETALDKTSCLIINLDSLEKIDLDGAYMLYIARNKANEVNKQIIFYCQKNIKVKRIFTLAGINYYKTIPSTV